MVHPQSMIDKAFMRGKDTIIILAAVGSFFMFCVRYYNIPDTIAAQAHEIQETKIMSVANDKQIAVIQADLTNIKNSQTQTQESQKAIWGVLRSINNKIPDQ